MEHNKIRVVLLDDDENILNILYEFLDFRGYEIYSFETPDICPLQLEPDCRCEDNERCVDVIIADFYMPVINGLEFIENQKINGCKAPYIAMMSGGWEEEGLLRAKELGCKVIHKPFNLKDIDEWLDEVEKNINLERELKDWFKEPLK